MEASTSESGGGARPGRRRSGMARWLPGGTGRGDAHGDAFVEELETEVALLREENARLRTRHGHDGAGPGQLRIDLPVPAAADASAGAPVSRRADDASELLTECRILRATLLDACRDAERALREIRRRLDELGAHAELERLEASGAAPASGPPRHASADR